MEQTAGKLAGNAQEAVSATSSQVIVRLGVMLATTRPSVI